MATKNNNHSIFYVILLIGLFIRLCFLIFYKQDMWHDASFTYLFSKEPISFILSGNDVHPPLYYLFMKVVLLFSSQEVWIRGINLLFYVWFMWFAYKLLLKRIGKNATYFSLILFSLSSTMIYYSVEPRNYMIGLMLVVAQAFYFYELLEKDTKANSFWLIITSLAMIYTHYFTGLLLIAESIILYLNHRKDINMILRFVNPAFYITFFTIPLTIYLGISMTKIQGFWFKDIGLGSLLSTISYQFYLPETVSLIHAIILFGILIPFSALLIIGKKYDELILFFIPVMVVFIISQLHPMYHHRFFMFYAIFLYAIIGMAINLIYKKNLFIGLYVLYVMLLLSLMSLSQIQDALPKELYESQTVLKQSIDKVRHYDIIHTTPFSMTPYRYYLRGYNTTNWLLTNLNEKELFTAGGSIIENEMVIHENNFKDYIFVSESGALIPQGSHIYYDKGGLIVYAKEN